MSLFSRSNSRGHYPHSNHGSHYYKGHGSGGGFLGKIMRLFMGSRGHSRSRDHFGTSHRSYNPRHKSWS